MSCLVKNCESNYTTTEEDLMFTLPMEDYRLNEWMNIINNANGENIVVKNTDVICFRHFDDNQFVKTSDPYSSKTRLKLISAAVPTIFKKVPRKDKRGSCGYANLQKARMKKVKRKERMRHLMMQRLQQKTVKQKSVADSYYFSRRRKQSNVEQLIIQLRLYGGENLSKKVPEPIKDTKLFPTFNITHNMIGLFEGNPVDWNVSETSRFVREVSSVSIAKAFRSENIDGEALLNLSLSDLIRHLQLDPTTAKKLHKILSDLRNEIIERFINI